MRPRKPTSKNVIPFNPPKPPTNKPASQQYEPTEEQICLTFRDYVKKTHPLLAPSLIRIENAAKRSWQQGYSLKQQGLRAGVSDYFFMMPMTKRGYDLDGAYQEFVFCGLWLEMKTKHGKQSLVQKTFEKLAFENGYVYECAFGLDEAIEVFEAYITPNF